MKPEKDTYRFIQWATGGLGTKCIRAIQDIAHLELVGAWVSSEAKDGKDAGEIAGIGPIGIAATMDVEAICALEADVVHYAPALPDWEVVCRLLRSGKNVMSPLHYTFLSSNEDLMQQVHEAGVAGHASYYGTGIYPDWSAARMVLACTALCTDIRQIRFTEQNARMLSFGSEEFVMFDVLRFGSPMEQAHEPSASSVAFHDCLRAEITHVGAALGYQVDEVLMTHEPMVALRRIERPNYTRAVEEGTVAGWKSVYTGLIGGKSVLEYTSYHVADALAVDDSYGVTDDASYTIEIDANPPTHMKWTALESDGMTAAEACYQATAMNNLSVVPGLCAANPGIVFSTDMHQAICGYRRLQA